MNRSWSGFLPQNEVILLQWALMEENWVAPKTWVSPEEGEGLESEIQQQALESDKLPASSTNPRSGRKR